MHAGIHYIRTENIFAAYTLNCTTTYRILVHVYGFVVAFKNSFAGPPTFVYKSCLFCVNKAPFFRFNISEPNMAQYTGSPVGYRHTINHENSSQVS